MLDLADPVGLEGVLGRPGVVSRFWRRVLIVPGSECLWWTGAIADKGHGRFWLRSKSDGRDHVIIAHRFAFALAYGVEALAAAPMLGHTCDNPMCQNVLHHRPMDSAQNSHEWAVRRHRPSWPLRDGRGARGRAVAVRNALRAGESLEAALAAGDVDRDQLALFGDSWS